MAFVDDMVSRDHREDDLKKTIDGNKLE